MLEFIRTHNARELRTYFRLFELVEELIRISAEQYMISEASAYLECCNEAFQHSHTLTGAAACLTYPEIQAVLAQP